MAGPGWEATWAYFCWIHIVLVEAILESAQVQGEKTWTLDGRKAKNIKWFEVGEGTCGRFWCRGWHISVCIRVPALRPLLCF